MSDEKNCIMDPLTVLCKLALIYFMPDGTKLSINHYVLHLQEHTYYQCIERIINGDSRKDISHLYPPILKAIKWYILESDEQVQMDDQMKKDMMIIVKYSIKGLQKLQENTYENDVSVKLILQYFVNLLRDASNGIYSDDNTLKIIGETNVLSNTIKNKYNPDVIKSIANMMKDADKNTQQKSQQVPHERSLPERSLWVSPQGIPFIFFSISKRFLLF